MVVAWPQLAPRQALAFERTVLREHTCGTEAAHIMLQGLSSADPAEAVARAIHLSGNELVLSGATRVRVTGRVFAIAIGKAAEPMLDGLLTRIPHIDRGIVVCKHGRGSITGRWPSTVKHCIAAHPVPDERSVRAGEAVLELASTAGPEDVVIVLVSGGASALVTAPRAPVLLEDLQALTRGLLRSGAPIESINAVRKHLDAVKGGGLARAAAPARVIALVLSDVVGDRIDVVASGPTAHDDSTWDDVARVLAGFGGANVPQSVRSLCDAGVNGHIPDTPKSGAPELDHVTNVLVGSNAAAVAAMKQAASLQGWRVAGQSQILGEARDVGRHLATLAKERLVDARSCWLAGGETTVTVRGDGFGGRNTELALASVPHLADTDLVLVTLATDGEDGPTDAAGAVVDGTTLQRALALGLDPHDFLQHNDSYRFFAALGDLVCTGPTGTNVCDLALVFRSSP